MLHAYHRHAAHGGSDARSAPGLPGADRTGPALEGHGLQGYGVEGYGIEVDGIEVDGPETLDRCDAYVVLVVDPETAAVDSYGPLSGPDALAEAERRRRDLDAGDLRDVAVQVVRHHAVRVRG